MPDRVRFFAIDPSNPTSPLTDITSPDVARVFPRRYDQPSAIQSPDTDEEGFTDNPLDDQNAVYGLTVDQKHSNSVFVTERERGLVRQLEIEPTSAGTLTYRVVRTFLFDTSFDLKDAKGGRYAWTPCREAVEEEPQSEGIAGRAERRGAGSERHARRNQWLRSGWGDAVPVCQLRGYVAGVDELRITARHHDAFCLRRWVSCRRE